MSVKQDRSGARTPADLERKYNFGKTFAEMLGLINDSRDKVDSVESGLRNEITQMETKLRRDTENIAMSAAKTVTSELEGEVKEVANKVEMKMDADDLTIAIENRFAEGVDSVTTRTGYRFDVDGLSITKSGTEIENLIDNSGMYVKRSGEEVLTANKNGVNAMNLHAKTYLIVGTGNGSSRFEDFGINRTGCFWIGG